MLLKYLMVSCTAVVLGLGVAPPSEAAGNTSAAQSSSKKKVAKATQSKRIKQASIKKASRKSVAAAPRAPHEPDFDALGLPNVKSASVLVQDQISGEVLFERNSDAVVPIASITKLMTGLIVVEAGLDMNEMLTVTDDDVDYVKHSSSRLKVGASLTRAQMLHIALMSSENRAASALGRHFPGGLTSFVEAMNAKALQLGMTDTRYVDSSGLSSQNVSTARDLAKLVMVAHQQPLLRQYSTDPKSVVSTTNGRPMHFSNTNHFVANPAWDIGLQKTGFINEAGRCLVMQAMIQGRAVIMVFLDAKGKNGRTSDVGRMRKWIESIQPAMATTSTM
ncbi:MAG: D-alanyl-D-alanine endopeptidase [Methyloversatilis sp.]|uniref:D-alanyl-D-alanine endopeptidase n=1 Tax=Methyloversatilis sp. TaxID=2569862 RepID=UPI0027364B49|nr:D-alanyl-D-alanine endopeptidase [Methyloversatilis sp.]MDP3872818.1 D-alanyl-D-alanine endopeptidase [Methyloversatilis sp.]